MTGSPVAALAVQGLAGRRLEAGQVLRAAAMVVASAGRYHGVRARRHIHISSYWWCSGWKPRAILCYCHSNMSLTVTIEGFTQ
jgi:hypothetical protein